VTLTKKTLKERVYTD